MLANGRWRCEIEKVSVRYKKVDAEPMCCEIANEF